MKFEQWPRRAAPKEGVFRRADELYAPYPLLRQHVEAGRLGRKSGRGFYVYS